MFIKEIIKKNKGYEKTFTYCRLMESYRTENGPRQRTVLNLGKLSIDKSLWKALADRIEAVVSGQQSLYPLSEEIETLAQHYAQVLIRNRISKAASVEKPVKPVYESVDLNSISTSRVRTIGAEHVGYSMFRELQMDKCLSENGFTEDQIKLAAVSVVGKLTSPGSERHTRRWALHVSGLCELMGMDTRLLSNNSLYRTSDRLLTIKDNIEKHLNQRERNLFSLEETILLYDLTNTYFEGSAKDNPKAKRGRSKEKRNDCPLLTLGMVLDDQGFPKLSKLLPGNVSEGETLLDMIRTLQEEEVRMGLKSVTEIKQRGITVILDAGISREENLHLLKSNGYDYIVVARNKPVSLSDIDPDHLTTIKYTGEEKVEAALIEIEDENILYCKSSKRLVKEHAMQVQYQNRFESDLKLIKASLSKKGGIKRYEKVIERIGRLKERYSPIARFFSINLKQEAGRVTSMTWKYHRANAEKEKFSGSYFLRSSRKDLDEKKLWETYMMLTKVEAGFRCLKDELKLRPVFHQKEKRADGHMFITILAYHLLNSIRVRLESAGIKMRWKDIRTFLSTHVLVTTSLTTEGKKRINIRQCSDPEPFHREIYRALGIRITPLNMKRIIN